MTTQPPSQYITPTLGGALRLAAWKMNLGANHFWLQLVPIIAATIWLLFHYWRHRRQWDWGEQMPLLLLVSFLAAPYGAWLVDMAVLVLPLLQVTAGISSSGNRRWMILALSFHWTVNMVALVRNLNGADTYEFMWMAPALFVGYLVFRPLRRPALIGPDAATPMPLETM
jgi:hypothetical protein